MRFLRNLSIRAKLVLISIIPSLALLYLLGNSISELLDRKATTTQVYQDCEEVARISGLIHQMQTERGFLLSFLATHREEDRDKIIEQEQQTNKSVTLVQNIYRQHQKQSAILPLLDSLQVFRADFRSFPEKLNEIKSALLGEIYRTSRVSRNPDIKNLLEAHLFLLYTKEYFSRTRNILLPAFIEKNFNKSDFARFASRKGQYELSREKFLSSASEDLSNFYRKKFSAAVVKDVHAIIDSIFIDPGQVRNTDAVTWWNKATVAVNSLAEIEEFSLLKIKERSEAELAIINSEVVSHVVFGLITLALIVGLVASTIRQIVVAVAGLKRAAQKLANGEIDFTVAVNTSDEMGDLAASFNKMVAVIKLNAMTAEKIGKGDYDASVLVRSDSDILGTALNNMKRDLQRLSKENDVRTWLLTGNNGINDQIRGDKDTGSLANDVISHLTEYLNAHIGALYVRENGHLKLSGKYAFQLNGHDEVVMPGQGFVGQAAVSAKPIVFSKIPDDYIKVNSALGNSKPKSIIVYPFSYEGEVKGVAEIGTTTEFSSLDIEFLDLISNSVGIAIHVAQSREKLKQLLEETQRQSEELETQQEELKQFNEELLEKTHLLERSEEELKAQHEELQQSNEELVEKASLLEEQKESLEFAKLQIEVKAKELEYANQYKSEFLSNMSHELRTPLNSILILAQVLMENRNKALSGKEIKFANTIYNSGNDLLDLINDILDLSKIEAGKMDLEIASFSIGSIVQDLANSFEELGKSKGIKFVIQCADKLKEKVMISDSQRLAQILKNFLANAFKFTGKGGKVELAIDRARPGAAFRKKTLTSAGEVMSFSVTDTGIGIAEEKLTMIFEAFQQVDGSTKRKYGGTGLGLSISRQLAQLLGGEIHVTSEAGKGSDFVLFIPAEIDVTTSAVADNTLTIHPLQTNRNGSQKTENYFVTDASHFDDQHLLTDGDRKILIMEDDVEFSKLLLDFVHDRNYKGIVAHQGNVGLSYARHYKPDAIILDMKLPIVNGEEVLKKLKSDPDLRHIPVQIISGFDFKKSALELGALNFIKKPVSRESFWKALDKVEHFVSRKPKKLLVIEDDQQHNQAVKELIGNGDVKCYSAYSGKEAYEILSTTDFDCIIVDLGLPDMTGFNFLEKIREDKSLNTIPVIVYTGKDLTKEENTQLEKLANTVVLKTAYSHERLLDETTLFLHRVESKLPKDKQNIIRKLHKSDEVLNSKTVLIADDDTRNVYSLVSALELEGLKCLSAANGKECLDLLEKNPQIEMVLMDVMMPEMDGFEATKAIRKLPRLHKIPVIGLTAKAMKGDREKCLAAGMSDYISKPVNVQQLLSLMRVWLYA